MTPFSEHKAWRPQLLKPVCLERDTVTFLQNAGAADFKLGFSM